MYALLMLLYRFCLQLFSPHFRQEFAGEMEELFRERLSTAAVNGRLALLLFFARELSGLLVGSIRQRVYAWRTRPLLAAQGGSVMVATGGRGLRRQLFLAAAIVVLVGLLLFLAFWIYMVFFFSFDRPPRVQEIALGDLTGNGYLDAYLAIAPDGEPYLHPDYLLFNEGDGRLVDSGQDFGEWSRFSVKLGDMNDDGDMEIVVGQSGGGIFLYRKGPTGLFFGSGNLSGPEGAFRSYVALADLNNDGSLDIFSANCCGGAIVSPNYQPLFSPDLVWLNDGNGRFRSNGQQLAQTGSNAVALGDLNNDGFADAFIVSGQSTNPDGSNASLMPNTVWFNDGQGNFSDSGQRLGQMESTAVTLGDVNGDGFLDAVVGNRGPDEIWLNDGQGNFHDSGQRLGSGLTRSLFLADLDGDGDLDLVVGGEKSARVWLNDGGGQFRRGQKISYDQYEAITLGDVTGDGIVDIFVAGVESYQVWRGVGDGRFNPNPRTSYR